MKSLAALSRTQDILAQGMSAFHARFQWSSERLSCSKRQKCSAISDQIGSKTEHSETYCANQIVQQLFQITLYDYKVLWVAINLAG